jgi:hypothetical protein
MFQFKENASIESQMEKWLQLVQNEYNKNHTVRNYDRCEMRADGITLLMRCQTNDIEGLCLVIATVCLEERLQSQGWFKSFLKYCIAINPWESVAIEDVNNLRLREYCIGMGFKSISDFFPTSYILHLDAVNRIEAKTFSS